MDAVVEAELRAIRQQIELLFRANDAAIEKARMEVLARLERMNEFREQVLEERQQFVTLTQLELLVQRISVMESYKTRQEGALTILWVLATGGGLSLALSVLKLLHLLP